MASLYQTSLNLRKILFFGLIIIVLILLYDTFFTARQIQNTSQSERRFYMNTDNKFGRINDPIIPKISISQSTPVYALRQSTFPTFPDVAYVYAIEKPAEKLETFEQAIARAETLGFSRNSLREDGRNIFWSQANSTRTLSFNRDNINWILQTDFVTNPEAIRNKTISSQNNVYSRGALNLLRRLTTSDSSYQIGFREPRNVVTLANLGASGNLFEVQRAEESEYVRVDVFRNIPLADLKPQVEQPTLNAGERRPSAVSGFVYGSDPRVGNFSVVASNNFSNFTTDVFSFNYNDFIYTGNVGKYFIINPIDAWTKVQNGQASLVSLETQDTDFFMEFPNEKVTRFEADPLKTSLGYYQPENWNGFVTPIYIIEGTATLENGRLANFTFFVNALRERASL